MSALLQVRDLRVHFPARRRLFAPRATLKALDGVSFDVMAGETLAIAGESGCGKSTLGRAILRLLPPTAGSIAWLGTSLANADRDMRRDMQVVFQDPLASLDPRMTAGDIIAEPLRNLRPEMSRSARWAQARDMMAAVGLSPAMADRYPHAFSGGQCQRIGIARAMILRPKLVICDEPVSALDVSVRAQVVNLLMDLQRAHRLTLIFISHDLAVVRHISHRVMVLYLGRVMEIGPCDALYAAPRHPYTRALLAASPVPDPDAAQPGTTLAGDPPSPLDPPAGCVFRTRCPHATQRCADAVPEDEIAGPGHEVACHHWRSIG